MMNDLEISILVYFASCALRECLQMLVAASLGEYFQDPRNLMDIGSVLAFMSGLYHETESAAAGHQDAEPDGHRHEEDRSALDHFQKGWGGPLLV